MALFRAAAVCALSLPIVHCERRSVKTVEDTQDVLCEWSKLDIASTGWKCETIKAFTGGMQGNTRLVQLTPPDGAPPFKAVLKEMNSNQNVEGLHSLENERRIAERLMGESSAGLPDASFPQYYLSFRVQSKYVKYKHAYNMSLMEKDNCDAKRLTTGICELNPEWNACNGNRGNIDTLREIPRSKMAREGLECPDRQVLMMQFLEGYADLPALQAQLRKEDAFVREVRAAALFKAHDELNKMGVSHCDYNPGNAMFCLSDPSKVKIIDFGLARTNDHPTGTCRGKLEDIGSPGFLWLSLYRGGKDETDWALNDKKAGPLSLSAGVQFQTPSGQSALPFSMMSGRFSGKGGTQPWNRETRDNWPGIVSYAKYLLSEYFQSRGDDAELDMEPKNVKIQPIQPTLTEPNTQVADAKDATTKHVTHKPVNPTQDGGAMEKPHVQPEQDNMVVVNTRELAALIKTGTELMYEGIRGTAQYPQIKGQAITFDFVPGDGSAKRFGIRVFWSSNNNKLKAAV